MYYSIFSLTFYLFCCCFIIKYLFGCLSEHVFIFRLYILYLWQSVLKETKKQTPTHSEKYIEKLKMFLFKLVDKWLFYWKSFCIFIFFFLISISLFHKFDLIWRHTDQGGNDKKILGRRQRYLLNVGGGENGVFKISLYMCICYF